MDNKNFVLIMTVFLCTALQASLSEKGQREKRKCGDISASASIEATVQIFNKHAAKAKQVYQVMQEQSDLLEELKSQAESCFNVMDTWRCKRIQLENPSLSPKRYESLSCDLDGYESLRNGLVEKFIKSAAVLKSNPEFAEAVEIVRKNDPAIADDIDVSFNCVVVAVVKASCHIKTECHEQQNFDDFALHVPIKR